MRLKIDKNRMTLFRILKELGKVTELKDLKKFTLLNQTYTSLSKNLFTRKTPKGTEGWEWDIARNYLTYILQFENFYSHGRITKIKYEKTVKKFWLEYLRKLEEIRRKYLK